MKKNAFAAMVARRSTFVGVAAVIAITLILLGSTVPMPASASSGHLSTARSVYPYIIGTRLDTCTLCHTPYMPLLNYYGLTLWASHHDYKGIESYDCDGDGWSNLDEIMALSNPGDPYDRPAVWIPTPTQTPDPTETPQPTATPEPTATAEPTVAPEPTQTPALTATPEPTPTLEPTAIPSPTAPPAPTVTPEPTVPPIPGTVVDVTGPASVGQGEEFEVSVVVRNVTGLYGGQFRLTFDPAYLQAVSGSLAPGSSLAPSLVGLSNIDNTTGQVWFAASRQGDQAGLSGDVVLATLRFTAVAAVENTTLGVDNAVLGDKVALNIPVSGTDGHSLSIISQAPETASLLGQVTLEGRAADNNDGAMVVVDGSILSAVTDGAGNFLFTGLAAGTYNFTADAAGYLPARCTSKTVVAPQTVLLPVELIAGDVNDDGLIDITDAVAIGTAFDNPAANPAADLNGDGVVNILDLILMAANFGAVPSAWGC